MMERVDSRRPKLYKMWKGQKKETDEDNFANTKGVKRQQR